MNIRVNQDILVIILSVFVIIAGANYIVNNVGQLTNQKHASGERISVSEKVRHRPLTTALEDDLGMTPEEFFSVSITDRKLEGPVYPGAQLSSTVDDGKAAACTLGFLAKDQAGPLALLSDHCTDKVVMDPSTIQVAASNGFATNLGVTVWSSRRTADKEFDLQAVAADKTESTDNIFVIDSSSPETAENQSRSTVKLSKVETPVVGTPTCSYGRTTGWRCGEVNAVNDHKFSTDYCSRFGDSGGPVITGDGLLGITSSTLVIGDNDEFLLCEDGYRNRSGEFNTYSMSTRLDNAVEKMREEGTEIEF